MHLGRHYGLARSSSPYWPCAIGPTSPCAIGLSWIEVSSVNHGTARYPKIVLDWVYWLNRNKEYRNYEMNFKIGVLRHKNTGKMWHLWSLHHFWQLPYILVWKTYLHANNGVNEEKHGNEEANIWKSLKQEESKNVNHIKLQILYRQIWKQAVPKKKVCIQFEQSICSLIRFFFSFTNNFTQMVNFQLYDQSFNFEWLYKNPQYDGKTGFIHLNKI